MISPCCIDRMRIVARGVNKSDDTTRGRLIQQQAGYATEVKVGGIPIKYLQLSPLTRHILYMFNVYRFLLAHIHAVRSKKTSRLRRMNLKSLFQIPE